MFLFFSPTCSQIWLSPLLRGVELDLLLSDMLNYNLFFGDNKLYYTSHAILMCIVCIVGLLLASLYLEGFRLKVDNGLHDSPSVYYLMFSLIPSIYIHLPIIVF